MILFSAPAVFKATRPGRRIYLPALRAPMGAANHLTSGSLSRPDSKEILFCLLNLMAPATSFSAVQLSSNNLIHFVSESFRLPEWIKPAHSAVEERARAANYKKLGVGVGLSGWARVEKELPTSQGRDVGHLPFGATFSLACGRICQLSYSDLPWWHLSVCPATRNPAFREGRIAQQAMCRLRAALKVK